MSRSKKPRGSLPYKKPNKHRMFASEIKTGSHALWLSEWKKKRGIV